MTGRVIQKELKLSQILYTPLVIIKSGLKKIVIKLAMHKDFFVIFGVL